MNAVMHPGEDTAAQQPGETVVVDASGLPALFEALLRGRRHTEPPDITTRICGICPVAYQMNACLAIEAACGIEVSAPVADLRRLLYCGEWIESHGLHIYLLHAPDFLGYAGAHDLAREGHGLIERGLALKKAGNAIMELVGGRAIHPVNLRVGGFYRAPGKTEICPTAQPARTASASATRWSWPGCLGGCPPGSRSWPWSAATSASAPG